MASTATLTAKTGPASQVTAGVFTNVTNIDFNVGTSVLFVTTNGVIKNFELTGSNTITLTASGGSYTLTVS